MDRARLVSLLSYDAESGLFTRRVAIKGHRAGETAGAVNHCGYVRIGVDGRDFMAHRLAWLYVTGDWPAREIDHINGIRTDNRLDNLRQVSPAVNKQNIRSAKRTSAVGLLGVSAAKRPGAFRACICVNGRTKHLGIHTTAEAAHAAYVDSKRLSHEGCTL